MQAEMRWETSAALLPRHDKLRTACAQRERVAPGAAHPAARASPTAAPGSPSDACHPSSRGAPARARAGSGACPTLTLAGARLHGRGLEAALAQARRAAARALGAVRRAARLPRRRGRLARVRFGRQRAQVGEVAALRLERRARGRVRLRGRCVSPGWRDVDAAQVNGRSAHSCQLVGRCHEPRACALAPALSLHAVDSCCRGTQTEQENQIHVPELAGLPCCALHVANVPLRERLWRGQLLCAARPCTACCRAPARQSRGGRRAARPRAHLRLAPAARAIAVGARLLPGYGPGPRRSAPAARRPRRLLLFFLVLLVRLGVDLPSLARALSKAHTWGFLYNTRCVLTKCALSKAHT